jgi:hypothetical protein
VSSLLAPFFYCCQHLEFCIPQFTRVYSSFTTGAFAVHIALCPDMHVLYNRAYACHLPA